MTDEYAQISGARSKSDGELYFLIFMVIFWPTLLLTGLFAHFALPDYELRLPALALSILAGLAGIRVYRKRWGSNPAPR